ncbi:MAG: hypothetical protein ACREL4_03360, partial [Gemmatimonadales bacterium]
GSHPVSVLMLVAVGFAVVAAACLALAGRAFRKRRPLSFLIRTLTAALFVALSAIAVLIAVGTDGYRALTDEQLAATVQVTPTGIHRFSAAFTFPDSRTATYDVAGDQLYVDARILKWHYWAHLLGLHTLYALDRVGGRYADLDDELHQPRTLYALGARRSVDLFKLIREYSVLAPLADAQYGSGTFLDVTRPATLEIRVSTTGLLVRARHE